jgi:type I restriction enzyme S subunit
MEVRRGYKPTDVGIIPQDWDVCPVGTMGDVRAGKALAVRGAGQQRPYLRTKNVFDGRIDLADVLRMPMTEAEFSRYRLRHGDILLNEGQSLELVGRCAMYKDEYPEPCAIQNQLVRFRAGDVVSASFAAHLFRYCQSTGVFAVIALQTTSVAHLGVSRFHRLQLAWPSRLIEQERIAEALNDADAHIESLERLIGKKRKIKQGAMQELLIGKKRLPGFSGAWAVKRLNDVTDIDPQSLGGDTRPDFAFNYIALEDVDLGTLASYSEQLFKSAPSRARRRLRKYDILVSTVRPNLKSHLLFLNDGGNWVCSTGFCVVRCREGVAAPAYVYFHMFGDYVTRQIEALLTGSNYPAINSRDIRSLEIPLPEFDEQVAIAAALTDMDAEIAALQAKMAKGRQLKQGMMQELLTGKVRLV